MEVVNDRKAVLITGPKLCGKQHPHVQLWYIQPYIDAENYSKAHRTAFLMNKTQVISDVVALPRKQLHNGDCRTADKVCKCVS